MMKIINKKFSKLEIILVGIILIFAIGFFRMKVFSPVENNKNNIESKNEEVIERTTNSTTCTRKTPYEKPPEFDRALSLIEQRFTQWYKRFGMENLIDLEYFNCLDIQYFNLGDTEGVFLFDENTSNPNRLIIKVDYSYKSSDDLLTAFLIIHEVTHAHNYLNKLAGDKISCIDDEVFAFNQQLIFSGVINTGERDSLNTRLRKGYQSLGDQLKTIWELLDLLDQAERICNTSEFDNCAMEEVIPLIENWVKANPYYQEQCNL